MRNQPDELIEIDYRDTHDWDAVYYRWESNETLQPIRSTSGAGEIFSITKSRLSATRAIALPGKISSTTAANILLGRGVFEQGRSKTRDFCLVKIVTSSHMASGANCQLVVFDPGNIIDNTYRIIKHYSRMIRIVNPRTRFSRLSAPDTELRNIGVLAIITKELVEKDSSLEEYINLNRLNSAFRRFANFGYKKGLFVDNIYNFLNHDILFRLENIFMDYKEDNIPVDGFIWLKLIASLAELSGEHDLLINYFQSSGERNEDNNAFATFYKSALESDTEDSSLIFETWNHFLEGSDYAKIALGVAELRARYILNEYTRGRITWEAFNDLLEGSLQNLRRLPPFLRHTAEGTRLLRKVNSVFEWSDKLSKTAAILKGDLSAGSLTFALSSLEDLAKNKGEHALAARLSFVINIINIASDIENLSERLEMEDSDAALGQGLVIAADVYGLYAAAYLIATGTELGGPFGTIAGVLAAIGNIIYISTIDSDCGLLLKNSKWGKTPYQSEAHPDWAACSFNNFSNSVSGIEKQLNSLINLLHKFEEVRDKYDNNVIGIEIDTNFLPNSSTFLIKIELNKTAGGNCRATIRIRFPSRGQGSYNPSISGTRLIRGVNARVLSEPGNHTIKINIQIDENVTSGNIWLTCYPFGHPEFSVPHDNKGVYIRDCVEPRIFFRSHDFEPDEWQLMPSW